MRRTPHPWPEFRFKKSAYWDPGLGATRFQAFYFTNAINFIVNMKFWNTHILLKLLLSEFFSQGCFKRLG